MSPEQARRLLEGCGAILSGHFELSSGLHSDRYFQCALLLQDPRRAEELARGLAAGIRARDRAPVDVVIGPALGAVTWACHSSMKICDIW